LVSATLRHRRIALDCLRVTKNHRLEESDPGTSIFPAHILLEQNYGEPLVSIVLVKIKALGISLLGAGTDLGPLRYAVLYLDWLCISSAAHDSSPRIASFSHSQPGIFPPQGHSPPVASQLPLSRHRRLLQPYSQLHCHANFAAYMRDIYPSLTEAARNRPQPPANPPPQTNTQSTRPTST